MRHKILFFICVNCLILGFAQTNTFPANGNVGIGTLNTSNGVLTVNGNATNGIRIENDTPGKEASVRLRSKSTNGSLFHADLASFYDGSKGYIGFKSPHNNTPGEGYKFVVNSLGNVGIGVTDPKSPLQVEGRGAFGKNRVMQIDWTCQSNWGGSANKWAGYLGFNA